MVVGWAGTQAGFWDLLAQFKKKVELIRLQVLTLCVGNEGKKFCM